MKSAQSTRRIIETLAEQHPNADTELHYRNAFELLVATILSAQSTDARVNLVTPALFTRYPDARALAAATPAELEPQILSTGFFRQKSKALIGMAQILVARARRRGAGGHGRADDAARRRPQDRERRARPCARRAGTAGRSARAARVEPHRHRRRRRPGEGRDAALRSAARRDVDARLRRADPARPPHLPADKPLCDSARCPTTATTSPRCSASRAASRPKRAPTARKAGQGATAPSMTRARVRAPRR